MAGIYPNYIQIVASADSGIKTLADLKGKRISVGAPKSGTELNARAVLKAAGLTYKDFAKVEYLPFGESVELMKNRQLDVTLQSAGLGVASLRDLAVSMKIVIVEIPADVVAKVGDPAYQPAIIPAGTYEGQARTSHSIAIQNFLVTHEGVSTDTVYKMTKAHVGEPGRAGRRARRRQGHQEGERAQGHAAAAAPGGGEVLPRSRDAEVAPARRAATS